MRDGGDEGMAVVTPWRSRLSGGSRPGPALRSTLRAASAGLASAVARPAFARPGLAAPRVEVRLGPALPGAVARLVPAALVTAVGTLLDAAPGTWLLLGALAAVMVLRPTLPAAAGVVLVAGVAVFAGPDLLAPSGPPGGPLGPLRLGLLVLCLDAAVRVTALAGHVSWTGRVERSVAGRLGRSVLRAQAVVQPALWGAFGLRAVTPGPAGAEMLRLVALVAIGALLALLVPRRGRPGGGAHG